jgi:hypothetical protein
MKGRSTLYLMTSRGSDFLDGSLNLSLKQPLGTAEETAAEDARRSKFRPDIMVIQDLRVEETKGPDDSVT